MRTKTITTLFITVLLVGAGRADDEEKEIDCIEFVKELNKLRSHPSSFVNDIETDWFSKMDRNVHKITKHRYREGVALIQKTLNFLKEQAPVGPVKTNPDLCKAARYHSYVMMTNKKLGHTDEKNKGIKVWMSTYGNATLIGESVSIVPTGWSNARKILLEWVIDDGTYQKRNRKLLFNPKFNYAGYGGRIRDKGMFNSLIFAKDFVSKSKKKDDNGKGLDILFLNFISTGVFLLGFFCIGA